MRYGKSVRAFFAQFGSGLVVCAAALSLGLFSSCSRDVRQEPAAGVLVPDTGQTPAAAENVGVVDIPDVSSYKQVVAVSDMHGMADNFIHLLAGAKIVDEASHWIAGKTLLVVVGDCIDKGPKSLEVLDLCMNLTAEAPKSGGRVVVLLGNHEAEFLADPTNKKSAALRDELAEKGLNISELTDPARPRARFLKQMPLAARVGKRWLFCHAGWVPQMPWDQFVAKAQTILRAGDYRNDFLIGDDSILEKRTDDEGRKWWKDDDAVKELEDRLTQDGLYGDVFGHQPDAFGLAGEIGPYSPKDHRLIKIDSGMAPDSGAHPGHLLVFTVPSEMTQDKIPPHLLSLGYDDEHKGLQTEPL